MSTPTADRLAGHTRPARTPFGPDTVVWREMGLITYVLTAPTAFVLQCMDTAFAAVSEAHSMYRNDPVGRAVRSIASVQVWVYGGDEAITEADRLREAHRGLNTVTEDGIRYTALHSAAWAWVLHTAVYGFIIRNQYFARTPLTAAEKEQFWTEVQTLMRNFLVAPKEVPATFDEWETWFADQVAHHLQATKTAHDYLQVMGQLPPPQDWSPLAKTLWRVGVAPYRRLIRFVTVGTLPPAARDKLGLSWTDADQRRLRALGRVVATVVPVLPERLRYLPIAYQARRVDREKRRLRQALDHRPI